MLCELLVRSCQKADLKAGCGETPTQKGTCCCFDASLAWRDLGDQRALPHLRVVVQVPQIQTTHAVHGGEERGVHGRPHHVVDVVCVILKRVQRLVLLRGTQNEKKKMKYKEKGGMKGQTGQARRWRGCKSTGRGRESGRRLRE